MKRGLVLEGGAMRGMFTAGVIDVMMEQGLTYDGLVGVSAGAVFGCNYKSRQIGRAIRYNLAYCQDARYASVRNLIRTGDVFDAQFCYRDIPNELDPFDLETYRQDPTVFTVVATDVTTGQPVYHDCPDGGAGDLDWFRASASMPLAAQIVDAGGYRLLDGGISDSIPLAFAETKYQRNVVVLTQPLGFRKQPNKALPVIRRVYKMYPHLVEAMERRHEVYNKTIATLRGKERRGALFVLRPEKPLGISRVEHDPTQLQRVYDHGRAVAEKNLDALLTYLNAPLD